MQKKVLQFTKKFGLKYNYGGRVVVRLARYQLTNERKEHNNMNVDTNLSHNVYSEKKNFTSKELPNYLIYNGNQIYIASCITQAIEISKTENRICSIFELHGSNGKYYHHLIDCSKGVL